MKGFLIFIIGFIAGILATILVVFIIGLGLKANKDKKEYKVQYIEVEGKKGNATLYTGITKDSVRILLGKPDQVSLREIGSTQYEDWGYVIKNKNGSNTSDLDIDFEDGKLKSVKQN
jgi:hypothetical protein